MAAKNKQQDVFSEYDSEEVQIFLNEAIANMTKKGRNGFDFVCKYSLKVGTVEAESLTESEQHERFAAYVEAIIDHQADNRYLTELTSIRNNSQRFSAWQAKQAKPRCERFYKKPV